MKHILSAGVFAEDSKFPSLPCGVLMYTLVQLIYIKLSRIVLNNFFKRFYWYILQMKSFELTMMKFFFPMDSKFVKYRYNKRRDCETVHLINTRVLFFWTSKPNVSAYEKGSNPLKIKMKIKHFAFTIHTFKVVSIYSLLVGSKYWQICTSHKIGGPKCNKH